MKFLKIWAHFLSTCTNSKVWKYICMQHWKGKLSIQTLEALIKGVLIKLEDQQNWSMRSTLIFKNIHEENKSTWKDIARVLGHFISKVLVDMNYSYDKLDMFISRAQRDNQHSSKSHHKGPTPLLAQFTN